jgi:hypothetical protein
VEAEEILAEALKAHTELAKHDYDKQIAAIHDAARTAYTARDAAAWADCYKRLASICDFLGKKIPPPPPMTAAQMIFAFGRELEELADWAREHKRYDEFRADFENIRDELRRISPQSPQAESQVLRLYQTKFEDLTHRLKAPQSRGGLLRRVQSNAMAPGAK